MNTITVDSIFSSDCIYKIPIYQRNFAWEEKHISELIEDIYGNNDGYFLGNIIVNEEKKNIFTVIDGQQRLTTLFIIYKAMKMPVKMKLRFEYREESEKLLKNLESEYYTGEEWSKKIIIGYKIIKDNPALIESNQEEFKNKLKNTRIFRIPVPEGTELNHYFEIMNTRGEQLEKVDILKSRLMEKLHGQRAKTEFACIWDACSNMKDYVVKSLKEIEPKIFNRYFRVENKEFVWISDTKRPLEGQGGKKSQKSLSVLLRQHKERSSEEDKQGNNQSDGHYESLVQFPEFLLHVLNIIKSNTDEPLDDPLDREKLLDRFNKVKLDPGDFINKLLKFRFLYDMYIGRIKAEAEEDSIPDNNDNEDDFGIRKLRQRKENSYSEKRTFNDRNIMALQWALRITHTSQKSMQWITSALKFTADSYYKSGFEKKYLAHLENWTMDNIRKDSEELSNIESLSLKSEIMNLGLGTPHIIFAYLDYLLQRDDPVGPSDYYYNFRTSVEHLYTQNEKRIPDGEKLQNYKKYINNFGNLFLVNREANSILSHDFIGLKLTKWKTITHKMPPKLAKAKDIFYNNGGEWKDDQVRAHCEAMIEVLKENL